MSYPRNERSHPYSIYIIALFVSLLILIGDTTGITRFIRIPLEVLVIPPRRVVSQMKTQVNNNVRIIFTPNLEAKLLEADEKSLSLDVLQSKIQLLEEENASLRSQLETPLPVSWDFIPALVLGIDRYLIVDKGEKDKVVPGMIVVYKDVVVGRVKSVNARSSVIELPTDPQFKIPARTNKNVRGLLTGVFGNKIMLSRILQKESVNTFDIVLSSGEEGGVPPNLVIGKIAEVISSPGEVYKEATVEPIIDTDRLTEVFIISSF